MNGLITLEREYECPRPNCDCSNNPCARGFTNLVKWTRIALVISLIVSSDRHGIPKPSCIVVANNGSI
jgi:hypothetical protein